MPSHLQATFHAGGIWVWPLLVLAVLILINCLERALVLSRARINLEEFLARIRGVLLATRDVRAAITIAREQRGPVAAVVGAALGGYGRGREEIERTVADVAIFEGGRLERGLMVLNITAKAAPLVGFFGTVTGMTGALTAASTGAPPRAGSLSAELMGTLLAAAAGLLVAIPAQLGYNYFLGRVQRHMREVETAADAVVGTLMEMDGQRGGDGEA